jgi:iron complex outermembrane receptor protein
MIRSSRTGLAPMACLAGIAAAVPGIALSQALEEVVVTAERREMALQDTPISIIALSSETIERKGIEDISDIALFTPNLAINGARGLGNNQPTFSIRGVSGGGGATSERGVALYIDNIFVPRTNGSVFKVFDVERIEVLRGPQGTLFGRNSTGGAIRLFTKQPSKEFESYLRGTLGNFDRQEISGMVNVPVSDRFAVRAQAAYLSEDGYVRRGTQDLGSSKDWLGRLQFAYDFNDDMKLTVGALYSKSESDGNPADFETFDMNPGLVEGNFADWLSDALALAGQPRLEADDDPRLVLDDYTMPAICLIDDFDPDWDAACNQVNDNEYYQLDAKLDWNLSENVTFTSVTGGAKLDHVGITDWQLLGTESRPDDVESEVFYQELQFNIGLANGRIDLVTGLNYFYEDASSAGVTLNRRGTSTFVFTPAMGTIAAMGVGFAGDPMFPALPANSDRGIFTSGDSIIEQESNSLGWFNSATWHATDKLNLTVGARLAHDKKDYKQERFATTGDAFTPAPGTTSTVVTTDDSWTEVDWRGTLDFHFTDGLMAYATASKAYRAGQFSFTVLSGVPGPDQSGDFIKSIPPEEVINYELGLRGTFFDGRLRINPTVYKMDWSNRQGARQINCTAEGTAACPIGFRILVVDSGDIDIEGAELDAQLAITDRFSLDGSFGYNNGDVLDPVANSGPNLFPEQPSPSYNFGATYALPLGNNGNVAFNVNYAYVGEQETHPTSGTDSSYLLPDYNLVNARIQWVTPSGRNIISLFGNNLADEDYATYATRFGGGFWDHGSGVEQAAPLRSARSVVRGRPREYGITIQHNFN